jgi:hypothetical protein
MRGDRKAELRKRLHQWNAKKFLQKLKRVAMLKGVEIVEVNPVYTSVIGMLKYAPQLNIDKDIAVAKTTLQSAWQVLRVALLFPILGRVLPKDLSPLKPILVEGVWDRVRSRLVPLSAGGTSR